MNYSLKDVKIPYYAKKYNTEELVKKIINTYHDDEKDDQEKKRKIGRYCTAISIRNIKKLVPKEAPKAAKQAFTEKTFEIVDKIEKLYNDSITDKSEKKRKISRYSLAIALRRGAINLK